MSDVEEKRKEVGVGNRLTYSQLYMPFIMVFVPFIALGMLFNVLYYTVKIHPLLNLAILSMGISFTVVLVYTYYLKLASELHGVKSIILTFRESRERVRSELAVIKEIRKIADKQRVENLKEGMSNPPTIIPLEFTVENVPLFKKMIVLSPCEAEELMDFFPDTVLWKDFLQKASVTYVDVTLVREIKIEDEYIPVVVPTGCSFITENIQKAASFFNVSKEDIDKIALPGGEYDRWKCVELKELLITREAELAAAQQALADFEKAVGKVATAKVKSYLKMRETERFPGAPRWLKIKKFWIMILLFGLLVFLLWLWLGR